MNEARELVATGQIRHLGDLCFRLGTPHETLKTWAKRYRHQCGLYELIGKLPRPSWYYSDYAVHVTRKSIRMFNASRRRLIAEGIGEWEAAHKAADDAVAKCRATARARRKARREDKHGPDAARFPWRVAEPSAAETEYVPVSSRAMIAIAARDHCFRSALRITAGQLSAKTTETATDTAAQTSEVAVSVPLVQP